jgi:hypothetical protein
MFNPASFLGFLATTAAHRAIMYGRHKDLAPSQAPHDDLILDPDYVRVKHEATIAVRQVFEQHTVAQEQMLEACFGLISAAMVVGNFEEARLHLKIWDRITSQITVSEDTLRWLPITNVKVSVALLERPIIPLLLERNPIPDEILRRIYPRPDTPIARMGYDFCRLDQLSQPLGLLLSMHADLCLLCELSVLNPQASSQDEVRTVARKAVELEFDLLSYPYEVEELPRDSRDEPQLPALEAVVRLAAFGMMSIVPYNILPAAGNGRALTQHQKKALEVLVGKRHLWDTEVLRLMCWVLLVFTQNALKQPEEGIFTDLLAQVSRDLWVSTWEQVEEIMFGFLYVPSLQNSVWREIWADVCQIREQRRFQDESHHHQRGQLYYQEGTGV